MWLLFFHCDEPALLLMELKHYNMTFNQDIFGFIRADHGLRMEEGVQPYIFLKDRLKSF